MRSVTVAVCGWLASRLLLPAVLPGQAMEQWLQVRVAGHGALAAFYAAREYRPVWVGEAGPLASAAELIAVLDAAAADGLRPEEYGTAALRQALDQTATPAALADLEVRLSEAFLSLGTELARGRVDPAMADTLWSGARDAAEVWTALDAASRADRGGVAEALHALRPPHTGYALLRLTLGWYRTIAAAGGWGTVPDGPALARGSQGERVRRLRLRLAATGDLIGLAAADTSFDATLDAAVRRFQARHGLRADGIVGAATHAELNVPVADRIGQMELNLERWRWLPRDLGRRYVMINIAAFTLDVREDDRSVLAMPVVVGRQDWETPIVSATAVQVVFAPLWNVPRSIAVQEFLPELRRDPGLLVRQRIQVLTDSTPSREIAPDSVDWTAVTESTFWYRLIQAPGPGNPLGGAKVVFPNRFDVAAHDTPDHTLFANDLRVASHGCVRLSNAAALVGYLLRGSPRWTADSVRAAMARPVERWVTLPEPLPVHLVYWTAWVDDDGIVQFRPDVYGWDARLAELLAAQQGAATR